MAHAIEANLFAFFQQLSNFPRIAVHDDGECCWTISDLRFPLFNSVMRARLADGRADLVIAERMQACRDRGVPMLWWTGPSTLPEDLGDRLARAGAFNEPAFGMAADLAHAARGDSDSGLAIDRVCERATLSAWSRVLCESFGAPQQFGAAFNEMAEAIGLGAASPFQHYLARVSGQPAGTCSLFLGAGVAGIYDVSTLPERRGHGIGAAITRHAMREASAAGYRMAILHASALGAGMYRSIGFSDVCDIGQHVWVPEGFTRS